MYQPTDSIIIDGGIPLTGDIFISGAKNSALPIMTASLLTPEELILDNIPQITDVDHMLTLLRYLGVDVRKNNNILALRADRIVNFSSPHNTEQKMRASIWVLGPLLARFGQAKVSLPGGCRIGARQVNLHIDVLRSLGAKVHIDKGYIIAKSYKRLRGANFYFEKVSVGATINAILAAVLAEGFTKLHNCAQEPEIVDLCDCLGKMGAKVEGAGSNTINIHGVEALTSAKHEIICDRIEAGTYMMAAAITNGAVQLHNVNYVYLKPLISKLQSAGVVLSYDDVRSIISIEPNAKQITAVDVETNPYPGFPTDLQPQFVSLMSVARGTSMITENIFENRFSHVPELINMGADINIKGMDAIVRGVDSLKGAEVMATDLRGCGSLIIAALSARGSSRIRGVSHLDRGYDSLLQKLQKCGANIRRTCEIYDGDAHKMMRKN